jgi:hypothetical protein
MQHLFDTKRIPSVSYGYTAGNRYRLDNVYGSLTLGGYDQNRFINNDVSFTFYPDISRDLSVNLQSIVSNKGTPSGLLSESISIFIDSTVPELWLPESTCAAFEKAFGISFNEDVGRYIVSASTRQKLLAQNAEVTFTIGPDVNGGKTVDIVLPYQAFDLQLGFPILTRNSTPSSYYFPLQRAANETQYTLGRTFLQEAYVIADYERQNFSISQCVWDSKAVENQDVVSIISPHAASNETFLENSATSRQLSSGAIAGIAVAMTGAIVIVATALYLFRRRRQAAIRAVAAQQMQEKLENGSAQSISAKQISHPMGGELGSGDVYEAPYQHRPHEAEAGRDAGLTKFGYSEMEGKGFAAEMHGRPIFEMPGSDVHEMGSGRKSYPIERQDGFF